jgi:hypothetical protein
MHEYGGIVGMNLVLDMGLVGGVGEFRLTL